MKTCILVLGMHRSGTSALTGVLQKMGIELGSELLPATIENEKGYFENIKIMDLNDRILLENKSVWSDTKYDFFIDENLFDIYVKEAKEILDEEFQYSKIFAIKDPRLCLIFPIWEEALKQLKIQVKIILPYRNPFEVAKSLKTRNAFSTEKSLMLWSKYFYHAEFYSRNHERIFVDFALLVTNLSEQIKRIESFLGIKKDDKTEIEQFIDSALKHKNISYSNIKESIPAFVRDIVLLMKNQALDEVKYNVFDQLREELLATANIFCAADVLDDLDRCKELQVKIAQLEQKEQLLEKISDVRFFDREYYLVKNDDVRNSGIDSLKHFIENGKNEGRFPNAYCDYYHLSSIDIVSKDEVNYYNELKIIEISKRTDDLLLENNHLSNELSLSKNLNIEINNQTETL